MGIRERLGVRFPNLRRELKDSGSSGVHEKPLLLNFNLHIPKTAGSSLNGYLTQKFSGYIEEMIAFHGPQYFTAQRCTNITKNLGKRGKQRYSYAVGHVPYSVIKDLFELASIFSVIRHPIDRWLSNFFYQNDFTTPEEVKENIDSINIARAREEQLSIHFLDNVIVRMLCDDYLFPNIDIDYKNFESAFKNLEKIQIINMSDLDDVFYDTKNENSKEGNALKININKQNSYADLISDELLELADTLNAYDMQLWNLIEGNNLFLSSQDRIDFRTAENCYVRTLYHVDAEGQVTKETEEIYPDGRPIFKGIRH